MDSLIAIAVVGAVGGIAVARDVSMRRKLAKAERDLADARFRLGEQGELANVGRLVTGLAQELKSPIQGVIGNTELMLAGRASSSSEELQQIRAEAVRAADIVRSLLAFTETTTLSRRWHDLNEIIGRASAACHGELANVGVKINVVGAERLPLVYVDGRQLEKVITTLLLRPIFTPAAARRQAGQSVVTIAARRGGDRIIVDVDDLFEAGRPDEPSWSADLAACRRVVEAHGGTLEVEPGSAGGFRFHVELPAAAGADSAF
jgi:two-component system sensor histidine kinase KdpD